MVKIKDLPKVDRPREKLIAYGPTKLNTSELLAIVLRTGTSSMNVVELSKHILKQIGTKKVRDTTMTQLKQIKGLGAIKAAEIIACIELGKRLLEEDTPTTVLSPTDAYESLKSISTHKKEHFIAVYFDTRNREITREVISIGILNAALVHPREVFEPALRHLANSVLIAHNHPSGDPTPSHEDVLITKKLKDVGMLMDIHLIDHLIIAKSGYMSFKEQGLL